MTTKKPKPRRSGAKIMASLIALLGSLSYIMVLAVINGCLGFACFMGVTISARRASPRLWASKSRFPTAG